MSEYTPRPWTVHLPKKPKDHEGALDVGISGMVNGEENIIAEAFGQTSLTGFPPALANARLIAMAPELLEACKTAIVLYDEMVLGPCHGPPPGVVAGTVVTYDDDCLLMRGKLEAAIAKAGA